MEVFRQAALAAFEDEMVAHSRDFSPVLCEVIGEDKLRVALRSTMARAIGYGFTNRGPIRLCVEMMFLFGSAFDTDPQYPWATEILQAPGEQMGRAEQLFDQILEYQKKVSGPDLANTMKALREVAVLARTHLEISLSRFVPDMLREIHRVFPQKADYIGREQLTKLIRKGQSEAQSCRLSSVEAEALMVVLMLAFGHGCSSDPLYPWIGNTLRDPRIIDPAARAERLKKKAVTWLDHVLARPRE